MVWPFQRTGMHSARTRSFSTWLVTSPSMISPSSSDRATSGRSDAGTTVPTQSLR